MGLGGKPRLHRIHEVADAILFLVFCEAVAETLKYYGIGKFHLTGDLGFFEGPFVGNGPVGEDAVGLRGASTVSISHPAISKGSVRSSASIPALMGSLPSNGCG